MHSSSCRAVWSLVGFFMLFSSSVMAQQQPRNAPLDLNSLGLPNPDMGVVSRVPQAFPTAPGSVVLQAPGGLRTLSPGDFNASPVRVLANPLVAKNNIGFYNSANQALSFVLQVGAEKRMITLAPREILTVPSAERTITKATIGSGDVDTVTDLSPGTIYVLQAEAGKWVFARL